MKRRGQLAAAVSCGLAAAMWTIGAVAALSAGVEGVSAVLLVVCAGVWIGAFRVNLRGYLKGT